MRAPRRQCVVLDIGGVMELTPPTGWDARWERALGLAPGELEVVLDDVIRRGEVGTITEAEFELAAARLLGLDDRQLAAFLDDLWIDYLGARNGPLVEWFASLRPQRRTALLSNSFVGAREREQARYGFADLADVIVYSHEVGLSKPDRRIYELTCELTGTDPADMVLLDDTEACVQGARDAGWQAVRYVGNAQAVADVQALLTS